MNTKVRCWNCKKELEVKGINSDPLHTITIEVKPCDDIGCINCSKCEVEEDNKEMRKQLKKVKDIVQTIKEKENETNK